MTALLAAAAVLAVSVSAGLGAAFGLAALVAGVTRRARRGTR